MRCGRRMDRKVAQHRLALPRAGLVVALAEDRLRAGFVEQVDEHRVARPGGGGHQPLPRASAEPRDGQPGQRLGKGGDVGLRIAGAYPQRVQFEYLARQILVEAKIGLLLAALGALRDRAAGAEALCLIEVKQHRRMAHRGDQQVGEGAHDVRADRLEFIVAGEADHRDLVGRHREMIGPEIGQALGKGGRRRDRIGEPGARRVDIMPPDFGTRQAAEFRVHALFLLVHRPVGGFAHRLPVLAIVDIGSGDRLAIRQRGDRGGGGVERAELARQPVLRIADRGIIPAAPEAETIGGKIMRRHDVRLRTRNARCRLFVAKLSRHQSILSYN